MRFHLLQATVWPSARTKCGQNNARETESRLQVEFGAAKFAQGHIHLSAGHTSNANPIDKTTLYVAPGDTFARFRPSMSIEERREAVRFLETYGVSVQRACLLVQLHRSTFLYQARPVADAGVRQEIADLAQVHPRYGYRRIWVVIRRSRRINRQRVHHLWKQARLQVRHIKRRRTRPERPAVVAAAYLNHMWAYDFLEDRDVQGNVLRILTVMDEFTREGLAVDVATTTSAQRVIGVLGRLVAEHGAPAYVRSHNGAEFVALVVQLWLAQRQIQTLYIDPGCPWQNGKDERFNGTVRDECLNMHLFASAAEAQVKLEVFRQHYNHDRPHSRLGYQTPVEFKRAWVEAQAKGQESNIPT